MPTPTTLIILGVTGDLAKKKVLPALAALAREGALPKGFSIVGFSRRPWNDAEFRKYVGSILKNPSKKFLDLLSFSQGTFADRASFEKLTEKLDAMDAERGMRSNRLLYLAVPPSDYKSILNNIAAIPLIRPDTGESWTRILVEKPFGHDTKSAAALNALLRRLFSEEQIFRIDHYLAKEMVENILAFRFGNDLYRGIWNNRHISRIEIRTLEQAGVEDRGAFYDSVGALRDVGQNHLLEILALLTMDRPDALSGPSVVERRADILAHLAEPTAEDVRRGTFRAQYAGYRKIEGADSKSEVETYFRAAVRLTYPEWEGVPIYLEAGKGFSSPRKEIVITLRHPSPCLCTDGKHAENRIIMRFEPAEEIVIDLNAKQPGDTYALMRGSLAFRYRTTKHTQYTEEYERLFLAALEGNRTLFVSQREIEPMWRFVDAIRRGWEKGAAPLRTYEKGTDDILVEAEEATDQSAPTGALAHRTIGVVGLGKMGANMARQFADRGWKVLVWNRTHETAKAMQTEGMQAAETLEELARSLPSPRIFWVMVPAGAATEEVLFGKAGLARFARKGDIIVEAGNSFYKDTVRRATRFSRLGIRFMDAGTSGGPAGARYGAAIMAGGDESLFRELELLLRSVTVPGGLGYMGKAGAGHFVKMVHNGIEYGMMQAIAEGFGVLKKSRFALSLAKIANLYNNGSVIESRLVGWLERALRQHGEDLAKIKGDVDYTGEGEWTVRIAKDLKVPVPVIQDSFKFRVQSKKHPSYMGKILSAIRNQFGGHKAS